MRRVASAVARQLTSSAVKPNPTLGTAMRALGTTPAMSAKPSRPNEFMARASDAYLSSPNNKAATSPMWNIAELGMKSASNVSNAILQAAKSDDLTLHATSNNEVLSQKRAQEGSDCSQTEIDGNLAFSRDNPSLYLSKNQIEAKCQQADRSGRYSNIAHLSFDGSGNYPGLNGTGMGKASILGDPNSTFHARSKLSAEHNPSRGVTNERIGCRHDIVVAVTKTGEIEVLLNQSHGQVGTTVHTLPNKGLVFTPGSALTTAQILSNVNFDKTSGKLSLVRTQTCCGSADVVVHNVAAFTHGANRIKKVSAADMVHAAEIAADFRRETGFSNIEIQDKDCSTHSTAFTTPMVQKFTTKVVTPHPFLAFAEQVNIQFKAKGEKPTIQTHNITHSREFPDINAISTITTYGAGKQHAVCINTSKPTNPKTTIHSSSAGNDNKSEHRRWQSADIQPPVKLLSSGKAVATSFNSESKHIHVAHKARDVMDQETDRLLKATLAKTLNKALNNTNIAGQSALLHMSALLELNNGTMNKVIRTIAGAVFDADTNPFDISRQSCDLVAAIGTGQSTLEAAENATAATFSEAILQNPAMLHKEIIKVHRAMLQKAFDHPLKKPELYIADMARLDCRNIEEMQTKMRDYLAKISAGRTYEIPKDIRQHFLVRLFENKTKSYASDNNTLERIMDAYLDVMMQAATHYQDIYDAMLPHLICCTHPGMNDYGVRIFLNGGDPAIQDLRDLKGILVTPCVASTQQMLNELNHEMDFTAETSHAEQDEVKTTPVDGKPSNDLSNIRLPKMSAASHGMFAHKTPQENGKPAIPANDTAQTVSGEEPPSNSLGAH